MESVLAGTAITALKPNPCGGDGNGFNREKASPSDL
jgi:hypothetical protein